MVKKIFITIKILLIIFLIGGEYMNKSTSYKKQSTTGSNVSEQMKYEVASELGVNLGPDASARQNGKVGGEMTRRLVSMAKNELNAR